MQEKLKVAHPLMLRAIAAAKKKNNRIDANKIVDWGTSGLNAARIPRPLTTATSESRIGSRITSLTR